MTTQNEIEMAKDFVQLSIHLSDKKEFIVPDCFKSDLEKEVLMTAIEELQNENLITVKKLSGNKLVVTLKNK